MPYFFVNISIRSQQVLQPELCIAKVQMGLIPSALWHIFRPSPMRHTIMSAGYFHMCNQKPCCSIKCFSIKIRSFKPIHLDNSHPEMAHITLFYKIKAWAFILLSLMSSLCYLWLSWKLSSPWGQLLTSFSITTAFIVPLFHMHPVKTCRWMSYQGVSLGINFYKASTLS